MKRHNTSKQMHAGTRRVHFEAQCLEARSVFLAGTFNDWQATTIPMINLGQGRWVKDLMLPPGEYEYRLVVDGKWIADPQEKETAPNPFGGVNSICRVQNGA